MVVKGLLLVATVLILLLLIS